MPEGMDYEQFDDYRYQHPEEFDSNWESQSVDEYDRYEDWYSETGYDPYHLFSEEYEPNRLYRIKNALRAIVRAVKYHLKYRFSAKFRAQMEDIPF